MSWQNMVWKNGISNGVSWKNGMCSLIYVQEILFLRSNLRCVQAMLCCGVTPNRRNVINLTHWGRVTHKYVGNLTIIGSDNGLSPGRRHAIIWTDAGILLIGPLVTNFSEILIEIHVFSFKKMHLKTSSGKWPPSCLGLNVLTNDRPNDWCIYSWLGLTTHKI